MNPPNVLQEPRSATTSDSRAETVGAAVTSQGAGPVVVAHSNHTRHWQRYAFSNPPEGYRYCRGADFPFHLLRTRNQVLRHTKLFAPVRRAQLYHTYNSVVVNRTPWIVEVEDRIPRYGRIDRDSAWYRYAMGLLRGPYCRTIAFSSRYAMSCCRESLLAGGVAPERLTVLYRSVPLIDREPAEPGRPCRILFVGHGFYRKGGPQLIEALQRLPDSRFQLRIVSTFEVDWHVYPTDDEQRRVRRQVADDPRIVCLGRLTHDQVEREMRQADLYACPTLADSFNSTILEAMGCGLPVLATRINAIPEFVEHEHNGLLVDPSGESRESACQERSATGESSRAPTSGGSGSTFVDQLVAALARLLGDTALRETFGAQSRDIIASRFSVERRNQKLQSIYRRALR